jgi:hypothetical protein
MSYVFQCNFRDRLFAANEHHRHQLDALAVVVKKQPARHERIEQALKITVRIACSLLRRQHNLDTQLSLTGRSRYASGESADANGLVVGMSLQAAFTPMAIHERIKFRWMPVRYCE